MRVNVYTEELDFGLVEVVTAKYVSSRTGMPMTNYGLRVLLKSAPELHYIPGRDDDRSAVTFWCGPEPENVQKFLRSIIPDDFFAKHGLSIGDSCCAEA